MMRTYDVLPTVAGQIGLRLPRGLSGRSATSNRVRRRGRVKVMSRAPLARITFTRARLAQGRRAAVRRKLALFGSGTRSLYLFGVNSQLLGRPVAGMRVLRRGPVRATLNGARDYRRIYRRSSFIPAHVTGRITGRRRGARRDIAVAVNGRIWAVTRSVRLRGSRSEYYSALVNPDKLVVGRNRNTITVYAVSRSRGKYVLRRLR